MMKKKYQSPTLQVLKLPDGAPLLLVNSEQPAASTDHGTAHSRGYSGGWDDGEDY